MLSRQSRKTKWCLTVPTWKDNYMLLAATWAANSKGDRMVLGLGVGDAEDWIISLFLQRLLGDANDMWMDYQAPSFALPRTFIFIWPRVSGRIKERGEGSLNTNMEWIMSYCFLFWCMSEWEFVLIHYPALTSVNLARRKEETKARLGWAILIWLNRILTSWHNWKLTQMDI